MNYKITENTIESFALGYWKNSVTNIFIQIYSLYLTMMKFEVVFILLFDE